MLFQIFLLFILHYVSGTQINKCPSGAMPIAARINDCIMPPCILRHGTNVTLEIDFEVPQYTVDMKAQAKAFSLGAEVNYILPNNDVCDSLTNGECPLDATEVVTYLLVLPISSAFPSVPVVIDFSLLSGSNVTCCFSVSCQVA